MIEKFNSPNTQNWCSLYFMIEKFYRYEKVEQLTKMLGRDVRLIITLPFWWSSWTYIVNVHVLYFDEKYLKFVTHSNLHPQYSPFFLLYYWTQKEKYAVMWCNFIIRNYIQTKLEIGTIVMSLYTWKSSIFSIPISIFHVNKGVKNSGFLCMQRQNYCSDFK